MKINLNNEVFFTQATCLQKLAHDLDLPEQGIAIAVDNQLVSRTEWATFELKEGMSVVIIKAACGG